MQIIMTTSLCGPELSLAAGDPYEADDTQAERLLKAGFARLPDEDAGNSASRTATPAPSARQSASRPAGKR